MSNEGNEGYWRETAPSAGLLRDFDANGACRFTESNGAGEGYYGEITMTEEGPKFVRTVSTADYIGIDYGVELLGRTLLLVLAGQAPPVHHLNSCVRETSKTGAAVRQPDWAS